MTGTVREYLYAGGEAPTAMRARQSDGSYKNYFFVTNTHGDVVAVTDRDGNIVNRYAYGPWGEATRVSEQVHQPFRYAGYRYEDGFDLYYLRARWYDAGTGRFLSRDPVAGSRRALLSINRYIYGGDRPPTVIDPAGTMPRQPGRSCEERFGSSEWWRDFLTACTGNGTFKGISVDFLTPGQMEARKAISGQGNAPGTLWAQKYGGGLVMDNRLQPYAWCRFGRGLPEVGANAPTPLWALFHEAGHIVWHDSEAADPNSPQELRAHATADFLMDLAERYMANEIDRSDLRSEFDTWYWFRKEGSFGGGGGAVLS